MAFLHHERATLARLLPGLDEALASLSLSVMEKPGNPALELFRNAGGPGLLIPPQLGGRGATPVEAVHVQRALGSRAPSLAVAATMHHFSVASVVALAQVSPDMEMLLQQIAGQNLYVASGVAEGRTGASILASAMRVKRIGDGLLVSGSKKPCCLSASMSLLTASVQLPAEGPHAGELAFAIIPADAPGLARRPFWRSPVLAGAESEEVILHDVVVPETSVAYLDPEGLMLQHGFLWFELLIAASYLGIGSGLAERALATTRGTPVERAQLGIELEGAAAALEGIAQRLNAGESSVALLPSMVFVRFAVQAALERSSALAAEMLGGLAFIESCDVAQLYAAVRALAFHPPARLTVAGALDRCLVGGPLVLE